MMEKSVAIVTMVYNDADYLKIWCDYYSKFFPTKNIYIIDHGSDDGATDELSGYSVLKLPRSPHDDVARAKFISGYCKTLLSLYQVVIYVDVDEIIVADPRYYATLDEYCKVVKFPIVNAIGLNVLHRIGHELEYDPERPILGQRKWVFHASSMCKPVFIRHPVQWAPGFHCTEFPVKFDHLYLFHLRWMDLNMALKRLQKTRTMPWENMDAGDHQRISDDEMIDSFKSWSRQKVDSRDLDLHYPPVSDFLQVIIDSQASRKNELYKFTLDIWPDILWQVPERFQGVF